MVVFCACTDAKYHIAKICKNSQRWECWVFAAFVCDLRSFCRNVAYTFDNPCNYTVCKNCYRMHNASQCKCTPNHTSITSSNKTTGWTLGQKSHHPWPAYHSSTNISPNFQTSTEKNIKPVVQLFHLPNNPPTPWKGERAWESRCSHVFARLMVDPDALNIPALFVGCGEAPFRQIWWKNIFFKN